jgi:hypothetical protein
MANSESFESWDLEISFKILKFLIYSILDKGLNSCGRGINIAVIDNMTRSILRVSNFDTYEKGI